MTPEFRPTCLMVTGGAGFIGSNFVRWVLGRDPKVQVVNYDLLTYAGNLESLTDVSEQHGAGGDGRYYFVRGDIRDFDAAARVLRGEARETTRTGRGRIVPPPDAVVHFAAESHVDRSVMGPAVFVDTNVRGTLAVLEACRAVLNGSSRNFRFLHISTDEVYGSLPSDAPSFSESTPLAPNSPYSASKAGSDLLVRGHVETFKFPAVITRCSNNYGPYQFPEKLIPLMITRALGNQSLPLYGDGLNVRDWIHVDDHAEALWTVMTRGKLGRVYNIGGETEITNLDLVRALLRLLRKPESLIQPVSDRPGHDRRYAMDITRIRTDLGWKPRHRLQEGLESTVDWYLAHRTWWERVLDEAYRAAAAMYLTER